MRLLEKAKALIHGNDIHKIITTIMSQGMLSIANFVIGLVLAKYASKNEYGLFVFLFSFLGIFQGYHGAVISAPLMVLVNHKEEPEKQSYVASLGVARNYVLVPGLVVFSAGLILYNVFIAGESHYIFTTLFLSVVIWMFIAKEYFRTLNFTLLNTNAVFLTDLSMLIVTLAGIFLVVHFNKVNALSGLLVLFSGYTVSYIYGKSRKPYEKSRELHIKDSLKENWTHGKWMILGIYSSIFQNRAYIYIISSIIGLGALADVSAGRLFIMPLVLLYGSINRIMVAKGALMVSMGENKKFLKFLFFLIIILIGVCSIYLVSVILLSGTLIGYLGEKYMGITNLIILWGIYVLISTVKSVFGTGIIVYKQFKKQAKYDIIGAVAVIITSIIFVLFMGKSGAIVSLIAGELVVMVLYLKLFLNLAHDSDAKKAELNLEEAGVTL